METHSIFKYTTERNGIHYIHHDKIEAFKKDPLRGFRKTLEDDHD